MVSQILRQLWTIHPPHIHRNKKSSTQTRDRYSTFHMDKAIPLKIYYEVSRVAALSMPPSLQDSRRVLRQHVPERYQNFQRRAGQPNTGTAHICVFCVGQGHRVLWQSQLLKETTAQKLDNVPLAAIMACDFFINSTSFRSSFAKAIVLGDFQSSLSGADPLQTKWKRARMLLAVWKTPSRKGMLEYLVCYHQRHVLQRFKSTRVPIHTLIVCSLA